jgi:DNA-binding LytR/AlgR family response regulator
MLTEAVAGSFHTIVVSARTDEAIRAFELGVTDFVPKPYTQERLRQAIDRVTRRDSTLRNRLRFLAVRRPGEIRVIPIDSVLEIRGAGDYSELVCADGSTHLHDKTLKTLELVLPARFVRVHRSHIVDLGALERIESEPGSRYFAVLRNGSRVPVSRGRVDALRSRLG